MSDVLEQHLTWCAAAGMTDDTLRCRRSALSLAERDLGQLLDLTPAGISEWLARPGWSQWTRYAYRSHLAAFFAWATLTDRVDRDPMVKVARPRQPKDVPRPAPREVFRAIVAAGVEPWPTVVLLAGLAGLRAGDICRIRREDVDEDVIRVRQGKGRRDAELPTHPEIWAHVRSRPAGLLVVTTRPTAAGDRQFTPTNLSARFGRYVDAEGLPHITLHQLRHLFGTTLYRSTNDILLTSKLMRHSSVATTMIYTELATDAKTAAIRGLTL